jgi:hypothetical protein
MSFLSVHLHQLNIRQAEEIERVFVNTVLLVIDDAHYTGINQHLSTLDAREVGYVASGTLGAHAMQGSLDDSIGFSMDGAYAMTIDHQMTGFIAMGETRRTAIKAGGEDTLIQYHHCAHEGTVTRTAQCHYVCNFHEVDIPFWSHVAFFQSILYLI